MNTSARQSPILVVDDEAIVRESITDWLREMGYQAEAAESGEQALDLISRKEFSVLILDYRLPGKSGVDVLRQARVRRAGIKAIVITAYPSAELNRELRELGALGDLLIKPVMTEDLEKLLLKKLAEIETQKSRERISSR